METISTYLDIDVYIMYMEWLFILYHCQVHAGNLYRADLTPALVKGAQFLSGRETSLEKDEMACVIPIMKKGLALVVGEYPRVTEAVEEIKLSRTSNGNVNPGQ